VTLKKENAMIQPPNQRGSGAEANWSRSSYETWPRLLL
jgi:hypothetical protein